MSSGQILGYRCGSTGPFISHLFFEIGKQSDKARRQSDEAGKLSAKVSSQCMGERKDSGSVVIAVDKSDMDVVNAGGKCERIDIVKKGVHDSCGGSKNKDKGEVSFEVEGLGSSGSIGGCVGPSGGKGNYRCEATLIESLEKGDIDKINVCNLDSQDSDSLESRVERNCNDVSKMGKGRVTKAKVLDGGSCESGGEGHSNSIRVFGSKDGSSSGVAVSGNQVVYINFEKGRGILGSGLSSMGGSAIDLYVDLGDLNPLFQKGKVGEIGASLCHSERRRKKGLFCLKNSFDEDSKWGSC